MRQLERAIAYLARFAGALGGVLTLCCVALVGYAVGMRYLLGQPEPWTDKVAGWLVVGLVMLCAPEVQRRFEHIGVDIARNRLGPRLVRVVHLIGTLSVALVAVLLLDAGIEMVSFSRMVGIMTELDGVPVWWIQALMPVGATLLLLVAACQSLLLLLGVEPEYLPAQDKNEIPRDPLARAE